MSSHFYQVCFSIGKVAGCHQRADRSFFINGKQFPVCARCTGVLLGKCIAIALFHSVSLSNFTLTSFCLIMFLDWLLQYLGIKESTNVRRLVTGTLCGYALLTLFLRIMLWLKYTIL